MLNLGKLTKLVNPLRSSSLLSNISQPSPFLASTLHLSLISNQKQYFAGRKKTSTRRRNDDSKSFALSDEKSAKLSKAEEEAEAKKKKMEAERARLQKLRGPDAPIRSFEKSFEARMTKADLKRALARLERERLGLEEEDEPKAPRERKEGEEKFQRPEKVKEKKQLVSTKPKPRKEFPDQPTTLNNLPRLEKPNLKKEVVLKNRNTERIINKKYTDLKPVTATEESKRSGLIAQKVGMISLYDKWGIMHPLTVLQVDRCQVIQVKTKDNDGYTALQLGAGEKNFKKVIKPEIGHFLRAFTPVKRVLKEFHVTEENVLPVGYQMSARHFTPGQFVDIQGYTVGRGFQGTVKKYGFKLQPKSHGNSKSHRMLGSTGQRQDPGRVFKNKKMPGRMGGKLRTIQSMRVYKVDAHKSLIYVIGGVPGKAGTYCFLKDAVRKIAFNQEYLNYPTFIPEANKKYANELVMRPPEQDPFEEYIHDNAVVEAGDEA